jgi:peptidoglycan/xylan/chitin deacetylase (PgdA/CDA1 family)
MSKRLIITVDTELSNFPNGQGLWGRVGEESWGLERLIDVFDEMSVRGTFFLDVYAGTPETLAEVERAAVLIHKRGHDLQLHTHPGPAFDRAKEQLRDYELDEQDKIIAHGTGLIEKWTGHRPVLHRAGDWAADHRSLQALKNNGFIADFSASAWSRSCGLRPEVVQGNGWKQVDGLLCGVGTCYRDGLTGRIRRVDIGGTSFAEANDVLSRGIDTLFLTLHSFSLLRFNSGRTQFAAFPEYVTLLQRYCSVARERWGYRTVTALEAVNELIDAPPSKLPWTTLPTTGIWASGAGILKSVRERLRA